MRKSVFILFLLLLLLPQGSWAQEMSPRLGLLAGYSNSNFTRKGSSSFSSFHLGARIEAPLGRQGFYMDGSLIYQYKGSVDHLEVFHTRVRAHYLEVPIHLGYRIGLNDELDLIAQAGVYAAYGLGGHSRFLDDTTGAEEKYRTFGEVLKSLDSGFSLNVGFEVLKTYRLTFNYERGWKDVARLKLRPTYFRTLSVSLGYNF